jgi:hypothetical protein
MTVSVAQAHPSVYRTSTVTPVRPSPISKGPITRGAITKGTITEAPATSAEWRLTDRGIAVAMAFAAIILTTALVVIGLTAVRVTSTDYRAGFAESQHDQR